MRVAKLATVLSVGLLLSSTALAQQPPGGGGFGGFGGGGLVNSVARSKPLQEELKVEADQLEKLTAALTKAREIARITQSCLVAIRLPKSARNHEGSKKSTTRPSPRC